MTGLTFEVRTCLGHVVEHSVGGMRWEDLGELKLTTDGISKSGRGLIDR